MFVRAWIVFFIHVLVTVAFASNISHVVQVLHVCPRISHIVAEKDVRGNEKECYLVVRDPAFICSLSRASSYHED